MAFNIKAATPDTSFALTGFLLGADDQSATDPSIYSGSSVFSALLAAANTWTATQTIAISAANTSALVLSGHSLTGANAQSLMDLSGTWNTSGVPTAFKLNMTQTAIGTGTKLAAFQVGGTSLFEIYNGTLNYVMCTNGSSLIVGSGLATNSNRQAWLSQSELRGFQNFFIGWNNNATDALAASSDIRLYRTAAGVLGLRGTNSAVGGAIEFLEQTAPAAATDTARIYAQDNGSGKTQLMVRFPTGTAVQLAIEP